MELKRGDIVLANLEPIVGSEQGGVRPVLVIQNDNSNKFSPTTITAPITSKIYTKEFPQNVEIEPKESKLKVKSTILLNQIRTIDKSRIKKRISNLNPYLMFQVDLAVKVSLGLE